MQITLSDSHHVMKNGIIEVIGTIESILLYKGMKPLQYYSNEIEGNAVYTNLLVPPKSGIRSTDFLACGIEDNIDPELKSLYIKKYCYLPASPEVQQISTTTAILINEYIKGNIRRDVFLSVPVRRNKKTFWELEIMLPYATITEGENTLIHILENMITDEISLSINPTWFSWASQAENFRLDNSNKKWGAIGVLRREICNLNKTVISNHEPVIIGVPVNTLADMTNREIKP